MELAKKYVDDVEFSAEDATRTEIGYLCRVAEAAVNAGATTINIPDTVGFMTPGDYAETIGKVAETVGDRAVISVHTHDDLGLAVANAVAALYVGARQVECALNGIGERAGNCSLEEVAVIMQVRPDRVPFHTNIDCSKLYDASQTLNECITFGPQPNKAIVGRNAFAHEAGIHQDGYLKHRTTYEIMTPESVGVPASKLVLGKHSGRHALRQRIVDLGYGDLDKADTIKVYKAFTALADTRKGLLDEDIVELLEELGFRRVGEGNPGRRLRALMVNRRAPAPAAMPPCKAKPSAWGLRNPAMRKPAPLLRMLAASKPRGRMLELGTGVGQSAAWILDGMCPHSRLTSVDAAQRQSEAAKRVLGADRRVAFVTQDGAAFLKECGETFDLIFADALPGKFTHRERAIALLRPGGLYVIDDLTPPARLAGRARIRGRTVACGRGGGGPALVPRRAGGGSHGGLPRSVTPLTATSPVWVRLQRRLQSDWKLIAGYGRAAWGAASLTSEDSWRIAIFNPWPFC